MTKELSHLLKRLQSAPSARIFPDVCQAALQDRSPSDDSHETSQHDHHLRDVCPDDGFQATLWQTSRVSCQGHLMEIWSFNKNLKNKSLQMINVPKTKNTETLRLIFTPPKPKNIHDSLF